MKKLIIILFAVTSIFLTSCSGGGVIDKLVTKLCEWVDESQKKRYKIDENANYMEPEREHFDYHIQRDNDILSITESVEKDSIDFELYISDTSYGFYHYYVWLKNADKGTVYIKAFEYNHNELLRTGDTHIQIDTMHNGMIKCGPRFFMIWDDFGVRDYLAKFELWYKPENSSKSQKLVTKTYKVSGFID
jgi:hypothetical protein